MVIILSSIINSDQNTTIDIIDREVVDLKEFGEELSFEMNYISNELQSLKGEVNINSINIQLNTNSIENLENYYSNLELELINHRKNIDDLEISTQLLIDIHSRVEYLINELIRIEELVEKLNDH